MKAKYLILLLGIVLGVSIEHISAFAQNTNASVSSIKTEDSVAFREILKDYATIGGILIAAVSLVFTAINTWLTSQVNRARFWLDLRSRFTEHEEVHRRLRPGGDWSDGKGPSSADEWAQLEAYMGLFEHCEIMLEQKLIDEETFRKIYRYRLVNIAAIEVIKSEKLVKRADGWVLFLRLTKRMNIEV